MTAYTSAFKAFSWNLQIINIDALCQTFTWTCAWHVWFAASTPFVGAPSWPSTADQVNAWFRHGGEVRSTGCNVLSAMFQPHSVESGIIGLSSIALSQIMAWRCVIMMWCLAAFLVRGNSSGLIPFWNSVTRASYVVECNLQMKCSHSLTVASVRGSLPSCERSSVFSRKIGNAFRFVWPAKYEVLSDPVSAWKGINASAGSGLNSQDETSSFTWMYFGFLLVPAFILHMCTMKHTAGIGLFMSTGNTKHI